MSQLNNQQADHDDSDKERAFQALIDAKQPIEGSDWMPARYRKALKRQMAQHAHSEWVGMLPEASFLPSAPSLERKTILQAKIQDEAGHALYIYSGMETLGYERDEAIVDLLEERAKFSVGFHWSFQHWGDVVTMGWLGDGAAIVNQVPLCRMSYGPYARAMKRICVEESFHQRQGYQATLAMVNGTPEQKAMVQDAINRFWWVYVFSFGLPDGDSTYTDQATRWNIKPNGNDELRDRYVNQAVPQIHALGLTVPDPDLKWDEENACWRYGECDWESFMEVVKGRGPATYERLEAKRNAYYGGAWVREAATAYAEKQAAAESVGVLDATG